MTIQGKFLVPISSLTGEPWAFPSSWLTICSSWPLVIPQTGFLPTCSPTFPFCYYYYCLHPNRPSKFMSSMQKINNLKFRDTWNHLDCSALLDYIFCSMISYCLDGRKVWGKDLVLTSRRLQDKRAMIIIVTSVLLLRNNSWLYFTKQEFLIFDSSTSQNSDPNWRLLFFNLSSLFWLLSHYKHTTLSSPNHPWIILHWRLMFCDGCPADGMYSQDNHDNK